MVERLKPVRITPDGLQAGTLDKPGAGPDNRNIFHNYPGYGVEIHRYLHKTYPFISVTEMYWVCSSWAIS
jgi:hypothetical protein